MSSSERGAANTAFDSVLLIIAFMLYLLQQADDARITLSDNDARLIVNKRISDYNNTRDILSKCPNRQDIDNNLVNYFDTTGKVLGLDQRPAKKTLFNLLRNSEQKYNQEIYKLWKELKECVEQFQTSDFLPKDSEDDQSYIKRSIDDILDDTLFKKYGLSQVSIAMRVWIIPILLAVSIGIWVWYVSSKRIARKNLPFCLILVFDVFFIVVMGWIWIQESVDTRMLNLLYGGIIIFIGLACWLMDHDMIMTCAFAVATVSAIGSDVALYLITAVSIIIVLYQKSTHRVLIPNLAFVPLWSICLVRIILSQARQYLLHKASQQLVAFNNVDPVQASLRKIRSLCTTLGVKFELSSMMRDTVQQHLTGGSA